jgi:hypothetical protein
MTKIERFCCPMFQCLGVPIKHMLVELHPPTSSQLLNFSPYYLYTNLLIGKAFVCGKIGSNCCKNVLYIYIYINNLNF